MTDYVVTGELFTGDPQGMIQLHRLRVYTTHSSFDYDNPPLSAMKLTCKFLNDVWDVPEVLCGPIVLPEYLRQRNWLPTIERKVVHVLEGLSELTMDTASDPSVWQLAINASSLFEEHVSCIIPRVVVDRLDAVGIDHRSNIPIRDVLDQLVTAIVQAYDIVFDEMVEYTCARERLKMLLPHDVEYDCLYRGNRGIINYDALIPERVLRQCESARIRLDGRWCTIICFPSVDVRNRHLIWQYDASFKGYANLFERAVRTLIIPDGQRVPDKDFDTWIHHFVNAVNA